MSVLRQYIPGSTPVFADDMNTIGGFLELLRNLSGADIVVDASGVHTRRRTAPIRILMVSLDAAAAGGGKYTAFSMLPPDTAPVATGDVAGADFGTAASTTPDVLLINSPEEGTSTHMLTDTTSKTRRIPAYTFNQTNADGLLVAYALAFNWTIDCPTPPGGGP
jgi:hypothetical protein